MLAFLILSAFCSVPHVDSQQLYEINGSVLVEFYATWCGFCQRFSSEFDEISRQLQIVEPSVRVVKVNIQDSPDLTSSFMISRIPSLFFIKEGNVWSVDVDLKRDTIVDWFKEKEWEKQKPQNWFMSPFGPVGTALGLMGKVSHGFGAFIRAQSANIENPSMWIAVIGGILFVVGAVSIFAGGKKPNAIKKKKE